MCQNLNVKFRLLKVKTLTFTSLTLYPCECSACCHCKLQCWVRNLFECSAKESLPLLGTEQPSFSHVFTTLNVSKGVPSCTTQFITNVTSFDQFFGPSSDLYYRTQNPKRNNTNYLYTFVINCILHNGTPLDTFNDLSTMRMRHLKIKIYYAK